MVRERDKTRDISSSQLLSKRRLITSGCGCYSNVYLWTQVLWAFLHADDVRRSHLYWIDELTDPGSDVGLSVTANQNEFGLSCDWFSDPQINPSWLIVIQIEDLSYLDIRAKSVSYLYLNINRFSQTSGGSLALLIIMPLGSFGVTDIS